MGQIHAYVTAGNIRFQADDLLAWWRPKASAPTQDIPGVEWVQGNTFDVDFRRVQLLPLSCAVLAFLLPTITKLACLSNSCGTHSPPCSPAGAS